MFRMIFSVKLLPVCYLLHPLESLLGKFGFAAVIGLVSVVYSKKAKCGDFDLSLDLYLVRDLL